MASIPEKMKAAVLFGEGDMRLVDDYPTPVPGHDEVLIRVQACAICGTDPKILAHGWPNQPRYGTFIFGHEYAGTVAAVGEDVTQLGVGDRVAVEPHKGCGVCNNCRDGLYTVCLNYGNVVKGHRHYGFTVNGGYAEYACNHMNSVYRVPDDMGIDEATLITTAGTSLYGIRRIGGIVPSETVVVSGPGAIGLMCVALARLMGAGRIILLGTRDERLALGLKLGADVGVNVARENAAARVLELTNGVGADAVLECAGTTQAAQEALEIIKKNGRIGLVATYKEPVPLNLHKVNQWNITIAGSKAEGQRSLALALPLLARRTPGTGSFRTLDLTPLITHRFPLSEVHAAFETATKRLGGALKVVVKP